MKIQSVKGTRDFYPSEMSVRNFIVDGWKSVSLRNGFEEYDGPIFEYLKMYQVKSGDEIAEQLFNFTDRGGRSLAIRPEITPTLARMVNQRINSLPRPIKWFSVPRLCRAERPQKGRLREFFQWNIDVIGADNVVADAEVIFCGLDYLQEVGLSSDDIVAKVSSRKMLAAVLEVIGVASDELDGLYALLDKRSKLPAETFEAMMAEKIADKQLLQNVLALMAVESIDQIAEMFTLDDKAKDALDELRRLFDILETMGVGEFCRFDISVVRGLAYYTGVVFEIYDKASQLRAIGGGGRYDNLLRDFGGPAVTATGFGMGDCVLEILLREKGLIDGTLSGQSLDYFVIFAGEEFQQKAIEVTAMLRRAGFSADFSYKGGNLGKQLKQASSCNAKKCVIIGTEFAENSQFVVKEMATGQQVQVDADDFVLQIKA